MDEDGLRSFFENMADDSCPSGDSKVWAKKGAQMAADCAILARWIAKVDPKFWPTLSLVYEMLNDPYEAAKLYTIFLENFYDKENIEQKEFVTRVDHNKFHNLMRLEKRRDEYQYPRPDKTYEEQVTWNLQAVKMGLRAFLEAPGIEEHFSAQGAEGITIKDEVMAGKIILLRFDSQTGKIGAFLTRSLLSECYRTVLKTKIEERNNTLFYVFLDEFQEYADFSDNASSDKNFIALAREYGGCFFAATQSMSALACKIGDPLAVEAFTGNCNNILSFYSHDPTTQGLIARYNPKIKLNKLKPGKLFAVSYNNNTRVHTQTIESLNKAYKEITTLMNDISLLPKPLSSEKNIGNIPFSRLCSNLYEDMEAQKREDEERQREILLQEEEAMQ